MIDGAPDPRLSPRRPARRRVGLALLVLVSASCGAEPDDLPEVGVDVRDIGAGDEPDSSEDTAQPDTDDADGATEDPDADVDEDAPDGSGDVVDGDVPDSDDTDVPDAPADAPDVEPLLCETDDRAFPVPNRACTVDEDCVAVTHQINCCGTEAVWGIAETALGGFSANEALCRDQYDTCRCPIGATLADDSNAVSDDTPASVRCSSGRCESYVADPDPVVCGGTRPSVFPSFDRTCTTVDDCAVVSHQTDCCGNSILWGIRADEVGAFDAAEAECRSEMDACGCPAGVPNTDSGISADPPESVELQCREGSCWTTAPLPPDDF